MTKASARSTGAPGVAKASAPSTRADLARAVARSAHANEAHPERKAASPEKSGSVLHALPATPKFPASKISSGDAAALRGLVANGHEAVAKGVGAGRVDPAILDNVHLLMPGGTDGYAHVMVTPTHVALVRKSGIVDLVSHADAKAQIATGKAHEDKRIEIGIGPRGFPLMAEEGPNGTVRLYRQLPKAANGEVPSVDEHTSFALTVADAFHPWGESAHTVTITVPHELLKRVESGELGGTGWRGIGGIGIDVVQEVQIETRVLRAHLGGNWRDALPR